jgi:hypothetical protein
MAALPNLLGISRIFPGLAFILGFPQLLVAVQVHSGSICSFVISIV